MIWLLALLLIGPLPNAQITLNPGGVVSSTAQGNYSLQLSSPWTGTVTAAFPGCIMIPPVMALTNQQISTTINFTCRDIQSPVVGITNPANGANIPRQATLTANASDNTGVAKVVWSLDGATIGTVNSAPWSLSYTFPKNNAWHMLTAQACDTSGNQASSSVRFRVH